jgi:hypothetical protein
MFALFAVTSGLRSSIGSIEEPQPPQFDAAKLEAALQKFDHAEVRYMRPELKPEVDVSDRAWLQQFCALLRELNGQSEWTVKAIGDSPEVRICDGDNVRLSVFWRTPNHIVLEGDGWSVNLSAKDGLFDRYVALCRAKQELREELIVRPPAKIDISSEHKKRPNQALQHNDPSCHAPCVRTCRASWGRG